RDRLAASVKDRRGADTVLRTASRQSGGSDTDGAGSEKAARLQPCAEAEWEGFEPAMECESHTRTLIEKRRLPRARASAPASVESDSCMLGQVACRGLRSRRDLYGQYVSEPERRGAAPAALGWGHR